MPKTRVILHALIAAILASAYAGAATYLLSPNTEFARHSIYLNASLFFAISINGAIIGVVIYGVFAWVILLLSRLLLSALSLWHVLMRVYGRLLYSLIFGLITFGLFYIFYYHGQVATTHQYIELGLIFFIAFSAFYIGIASFVLFDQRYLEKHV